MCPGISIARDRTTQQGPPDYRHQSRSKVDDMTSSKHTSTCRWAIPTLFLNPPIWLYAWDASWTCVHDGEPRVLGSTECCATCGLWEGPAEGVPRPSLNQGPAIDS
jgi:hypothetical protein